MNSPVSKNMLNVSADFFSFPFPAVFIAFTARPPPTYVNFKDCPKCTHFSNFLSKTALFFYDAILQSCNLRVLKVGPNCQPTRFVNTAGYNRTQLQSLIQPVPCSIDYGYILSLKTGSPLGGPGKAQSGGQSGFFRMLNMP